MIPPALRPVDPAAQFIEPPTTGSPTGGHKPPLALRLALFLAIAALTLALALPLLT